MSVSKRGDRTERGHKCWPLSFSNCKSDSDYNPARDQEQGWTTPAQRWNT
jgi:hypothetical protein